MLVATTTKIPYLAEGSPHAFVLAPESPQRAQDIEKNRAACTGCEYLQGGACRHDQVARGCGCEHLEGVERERAIGARYATVLRNGLCPIGRFGLFAQGGA